MTGKIVFETMADITAYDLSEVLKNYTDEELKSMELLGNYRKISRITADKELEAVNFDVSLISPKSRV